MGWWGPGVFDGDTPLDVLNTISSHSDLQLPAEPDPDGRPLLLRPHQWTSEQQTQVADQLQQPAIQQQLLVLAEGDDDDLTELGLPYVDRDLISYCRIETRQVIAALHLTSGAPLHPQLADLALQAAHGDSWRHKSAARDAAMEEFTAALHVHTTNPHPQTVRHRSLGEAFQAAAEHDQTIVNLPGSH